MPDEVADLSLETGCIATDAVFVIHFMLFDMIMMHLHTDQCFITNRECCILLSPHLLYLWKDAKLGRVLRRQRFRA